MTEVSKLKDMTTKEAMLYIAKENDVHRLSDIARICSDHYTKFTSTQVKNYISRGTRMGVDNAVVMKKKFGINITDIYGKILHD